VIVVDGDRTSSVDRVVVIIKIQKQLPRLSDGIDDWNAKADCVVFEVFS